MPIEEGLFSVTAPQGESIGFLEVLKPRIIALYSIMKSDGLGRLVRRLVASSPEIDHVWLSGLTFNVLWNLVTRLSAPGRFARIVFTHDSVYEMDNEIEPADSEEEEPTDFLEDSDDSRSIVERRAARFQLVDRIRVVGEKLAALQQTYSPLYAISQLRFPSPCGRGGHDFYDNGKVTNRSESFRDHRSTFFL